MQMQIQIRRRVAVVALFVAGVASWPGPAHGADVQASCRAPLSDAPAAPPSSDPWTGILIRADQARAAIDEGRAAEIESELDALTAAAASAPSTREQAHLLIHLGRSYAQLAEVHPERRLALVRSVALLTRALEVAHGPAQARNRSYALGYLGELYERRGRWQEALDLTRRATLSALEADAPDALYRWQWQAARLQLASGDRRTALASYRRAVVTLAELRAQAALSAATWSATAGRTVEDLYVELIDLLLTEAATRQDPAEEQALLVEVRDTFEARQVEELRDYFHDECLAAQRKATPEDIPGTAVVYPIILADRLEILVGGSGRLERFLSPVDRVTLTAEVQAFRSKLTRRTTREYLRHAHTLYQWLIGPIEETLRERSPETVVFVPDGPLRTIPFAALWDRDAREFLIERYPVAVVPSLSLTDPRPIERGRVQILAAGISESVGGYPALEAVPEEIAAVSRNFPGLTLLNEQFSVARFSEEVERRPFGIIHVASHAEFTDDPSQSFLLAYDGKISMDRLAQLVATTRFRSQQPLELLTLSACSTAAGNERAALGLAGIALRAGARSALATLWSVSDQASSKLIIEFYAQLSKPEFSRAQALQQAQLQLIAERGFRHPAFWSPFILISSWL